MKTIPNILSLLRIVLAPVLLYLALRGLKNPFIIVLAISLFSDAIDGFLARKLNATSEAGARLDSIGDLATYAVLPACVWWLWPEIIRKEAIYVTLAVSAYFLPLAAGLAKFHTVPSYHTYGAKAGALLMCTAMLLLFIFEFPLLFRIAAIFQAVVAIEEIAITIQLAELKSDVKSFWHVRAHHRRP